MDWQLLAAGAIVTAAAVYLGRRSWQTWFGAKTGCGGCGGGCGKPAAAKEQGPVLIPVEQLQVRRRPPGPL